MKKIIFLFIILFFIQKIQAQESNLIFTGDNYKQFPETQIPASTFTLELIFSPDEALNSSSESFNLFNANVKNGVNVTCFFNKNKNGKIGFFIEKNQKIYSVESPQNTWNPNKFQHLTITWNGNSLFLYVNGANADSTDPFLGLIGNLSAVKLGGDEDGNYFKGKIQAFRVWSKVLSSRQIMDLKGQNIVEDGEFVKTTFSKRRVSDWLKMSDLITWKQDKSVEIEVQKEVGKQIQSADNQLDKSNNSKKSVFKKNPNRKSNQVKKTSKSQKKSTEIQEDTRDYLDKIDDAPSTFLPKNRDYQRMIDRYEIKNGEFGVHLSSTVKPYARKAVISLVDSVQKLDNLSLQDKFNLSYILADNPEWSGVRAESKFPLWGFLNKPILGFYKYKPDFVRVKSKYFDLHLNPVLHFQYGMQSDIENRDIPFYTNSRGAEFRGIIGKKVSFYSILTDNQALFPSYAQAFTSKYSAVPGEGFWKKLDNDGAVDFLHARGYIHFNALKTTSLQLGYDRHRFGNGYRSLFLSDFGSPYSFLKLNTKVWRITYTNLYAQLTADLNRTPEGELLGNAVFPKKYGVFHRLGIDFGKNLNIGFFESVIFGREDNNINDTFDLAYLNPLIFYRSVEQQLGSSDNALIGADFKWNFLRQFQLYGQLIIDEMVLSELRAGTGWWANKQGGQIGAKYIDVGGVQNLDFQLEMNVVRPYVYSHFGNEALSNYAHYRQPLAHPLGANFREIIGIVNYQPFEEATLTGKLFYTKTGLDESGINWGSNILLDNTNRGIADSDGNPQNYGHEIGQGLATKIMMASLEGTFMLRHNLFADAQITIRNQSSENTESTNITYIGLGLRLNSAKRLFEF